jgi:hypothetical protein
MARGMAKILFLFTSDRLCSSWNLSRIAVGSNAQ